MINAKGTKRKENQSLMVQIITASLEFPSCDHALVEQFVSKGALFLSEHRKFRIRIHASVT